MPRPDNRNAAEEIPMASKRSSSKPREQVGTAAARTCAVRPDRSIHSVANPREQS
jgi:hypothetical protein